jgi:3-methyladenine DNA glycosylase AlkD
MTTTTHIARKLVDTITAVTYDDVMRQLKSLRNEKNIAGMARFGIMIDAALGISVTKLRSIAKNLGKNHDLGEKLWQSGIHEARILAAFVSEPTRITGKQMEAWVKDFDSWDLCDVVCGSLFDRTPFAHSKAITWAKRERQFERRAGFALMAWLAVHDKEGSDKKFQRFFPLIKRAATDERNFVKKAVNWALRQIGKRNRTLNKKAIAFAKEFQKMDSKSARWIAADALKELTSAKVQARLAKRG